MQQMQLSMGRTLKMPQNVSLLQNPKMERKSHPQNIVGQTFAKLFVIGFAGVMPPNCTSPGTYWLARCECGNFTIVETSKLIKHMKSCGCEQHIIKHAHARKGLKSKAYNAFFHAKGRCTRPTENNYAHYGGRGIEFRFETFNEFYAEIGDPPSPQHTLDRIHVNGHYEKGNVRWATRAEQNRNTRMTKYLTFNEITKPLADWADDYQINANSLHYRIQSGWCSSCALQMPFTGVKYKCPHNEK